MITLIFTIDTEVSATLAADLGLNEVSDDLGGTVTACYKDGSVVLLNSRDDEKSFMKALLYAYSEYNPEFLIFAGSSQRVSTDIRDGDVILPNVLFELDPEVLKAEIDKENRDSFLKKPIFLEHYTIQNDYDFEDFGLRVGGIAVSGPDLTDAAPDAIERIRMAYEADVADTFAYLFAQESQNLILSDRTYILLGVGTSKSNGHISKIITFILKDIIGEGYSETDDEDNDQP